MNKILVVDDEKDMVDMLKDFFEMGDYKVLTAHGGRDALEKIKDKPNIILLDINMPDMDGMEVCKKIRNFVSCPIVFLTAKVEEKDRINGLMAGGDDYILKPFSLDELDARIKAHLRRESRRLEQDDVKFLNGFVMDYSQKKLFYNNKEIELTKTEFDILEILTMNKDHVFSKESIYEKIWGFDKDGDSSIITEHIRRIRGKIKKFTDDIMIETVWGIGYRWIG